MYNLQGHYGAAAEAALDPYEAALPEEKAAKQVPPIWNHAQGLQFRPRLAFCRNLTPKSRQLWPELEPLFIILYRWVAEAALPEEKGAKQVLAANGSSRGQNSA